MNNFTASDLFRITEALLIFPLFLLAPGYCVAWLADVFSFRKRSPALQLAFAVPASFGFSPVVIYLAERWNPALIWPIHGILALLFIYLITTGTHPSTALPKLRYWYFGIVAAWTVLAVLTLMDLQWGTRDYFPTVVLDYALRADVTSAISRTGVPPHNPLFYPGHYYPLRYHYFWYILCAAVQNLGGAELSSRQAMIAGTAWCGIGLMALIPLYLRFVSPRKSSQIDRRAFIGIALLGVTGLDLAPVLFGELASGRLAGSLEWWNEPVGAWVSLVLWAPHHVAGLVACLTGFLFLWDAQNRNSIRRQLAPVALAGIMFASAAGLSIYVTFVFGCFVLCWMIVALFRQKSSYVALICLSGVVAVIFALPFLMELTAKDPSMGIIAKSPAGGVSQFPFRLQVRKFPFLLLALGIRDSSSGKAALADLIGLPLNYLFELGFFLIAGIAFWLKRRRKRTPWEDSEICLLIMTLVSVTICSFVKSSLIENNDLGLRGFMVAQFVLLLWGAELLSEGPQGLGDWGILIVPALLLGAAGSVYEVLSIRFLPVLSDRTTAARTVPWIALDDKLGERTFALRTVYEELRRRTPPKAVVQHNPNVDPQDNFHGMYADRQLAAETVNCGVLFGGDPVECRHTVSALTPLFGDASLSPADVNTACRNLSVDVLVMQPGDNVWKVRTSWIWNRKPMIANDYARVFRCGSDPNTDLP